MSELIRRQDALEALGEEPPVWYDDEDEIAERNQWRRAVKAIKAVPSAQPERTGKWIFHDVEDFKGRPTGKHFCKCNQCEKEEILGHRRKPFNYCPNCGAKMEGEERD